MVETKMTCPLGSTCEEIKDGAIYRCAWFIEVKGENPNTGEALNERGCAMTWLPMLMIDNSMRQRSTNSAIESFRNEMVKGNEMFLSAYSNQSLLK